MLPPRGLIIIVETMRQGSIAKRGRQGRSPPAETQEAALRRSAALQDNLMDRARRGFETARRQTHADGVEQTLLGALPCVRGQIAEWESRGVIREFVNQISILMHCHRFPHLHLGRIPPAPHLSRRRAVEGECLRVRQELS